MRLGTRSTVLLLVSTLFTPISRAADQPPLPVVAANDNRTPAGHLENGTLNLQLELREARWYPETMDDPHVDVYAFAEAGHAPQISGPLIRVPQGTRIQVTLQNLLPLAAKVYGFHPYPGDPNQALSLAPGETHELQVTTSEPGTYMYSATTSDRPLEERDGPEVTLAGAFLVDPPGKPDDDRIFVISGYAKHNAPAPPDLFFTINGKSWPATEHLTYKVGETVHWRVINSTGETHAMHLHGFYFVVDGVGDPSRFTPYSEAQRRKVVTEGIDSGHTFEMTWTPERTGNWLFHCHMVAHMSPVPMLHPAGAKPDAHPAEHDYAAGMGGLVIGLTVVPGANPELPPVDAKNPRKLQLVISQNPEKIPLYKLELNDPAVPPDPKKKLPPSLLGPPIFLTRGQPVEIEVKNQSSSPTAIHWHGIELESYYDGVPGWTGSAQQSTPSIAPGTSFVARMAPPRAGTFIYHTHWHDITQLRNGVYGPLIVLEPGQKVDPNLDRTFLFSVGNYPPLGFMLLSNGYPGPDPVQLHTRTRYRFRFINITDDASDLRLRFSLKGDLLQWKSIAKDGADLPSAQIVTTPADLFLTVGSTSDVEIMSDKPGYAELQVSSVLFQGLVMQPFIFTVPK